MKLNFTEDDIVHSLKGGALARELDFRIELAKGKQSNLRKGMQLDGLHSKYSPNQGVVINLILTGQGASTMFGYDPSFVFRWGGGKVPWQEKKVVESPTDEELKTIVAGEKQLGRQVAYLKWKTQLLRSRIPDRVILTHRDKSR